MMKVVERTGDALPRLAMTFALLIVLSWAARGDDPAEYVYVQSWPTSASEKWTVASSSVAYYPVASNQEKAYLLGSVSLAAPYSSYESYQVSAPSWQSVRVADAPDMSVGSLDRLVAATETFDELWMLLSQYDRLHALRGDALLKQFVWERITAPEILATSTLSTEYRKWLVETLLRYGDRVEPVLMLSNFRLLPSERAASWPAVRARAYPSYQAQQYFYQPEQVSFQPRQLTRVVSTSVPGHQHGYFGEHVHMRSAPHPGALVVARLASDVQLKLLGQDGQWLYVETAGGSAGYIHADDMAHHANPSGHAGTATSYRSAVRAKAEPKYFTDYGWAYKTNLPDAERGYYTDFGWVSLRTKASY